MPRHCIRCGRFVAPGLTLLALVLTVLAQGCATRSDVAPSVDSKSPAGVGVLYPAPLDRVFAAALQAVAKNGLAVTEQAGDKRYILAEAGMSAFSYGAHVGIYLVPEERGTLVTVTSKRKLATNITAPDYAARIHTALRFLLPGQAKP